MDIISNLIDNGDWRLEYLYNRYGNNLLVLIPENNDKLYENIHYIFSDVFEAAEGILNLYKKISDNMTFIQECNIHLSDAVDKFNKKLEYVYDVETKQFKDTFYEELTKFIKILDIIDDYYNDKISEYDILYGDIIKEEINENHK